MRRIIIIVIAMGGLTSSAYSQATLSDGIYTEPQAQRGQKVYSTSCIQCHGKNLNGAGEPDMPPSPAIARTGFLKKWSGKSLGELFKYIQSTMPPDNPGILSGQDTADVLAHMFAVSNLPAGQKELPSDQAALDAIPIKSETK